MSLNFTYGIDAPQFASYGPDGARNLGYSASATLDIPLWDWLTSERKVKEAKHPQRRRATSGLTAAQRRLLADLAEFYERGRRRPAGSLLRWMPAWPMRAKAFG